MSDRMPAVLPTKRSVLERAAGFLEHHLADIRNQAMSSDRLNHGEAERLVLDATETAFAAGMLREMATPIATPLPLERTRAVR